ncbi:MAG: hypothetical protein ACRC46_15660 [Thermoguttaceae bacterium]
MKLSHNPFSSRYVLPDVVPFFFPAAEAVQVETLIEQFLSRGGFGQIVGPHGSGKTTLLAEIVRGLRQRSVNVLELTFRDRQRTLTAAQWDAAAEFGRRSNSTTTSVVVIDGFEQLSFCESFRVRILLRRCGLLLTAHRRVLWLLGFAVLYTTHPSLETTERVIAYLLRDVTWRPSHEEVAALYTLHRGNTRLVVSDLYDLYEAR